MTKQKFSYSYLTNCSLNHSIQATLWGVQVARDLLLTDLPLELIAVFCETQHIFKAEGWLAGIKAAGAGIYQLRLYCADVRHGYLVYKGPKACRYGGQSKFETGFIRYQTKAES